MSLKRKVISNPSKLKRLTEELNTKHKEADLKISLISTEKPMLRILSNTETTNFKNLTKLLTQLPSWEETLTGRKLINLLSWTKHLLKNQLSLWLKAPKILLVFWEDLPVTLNLKNLLRLLLLKTKLLSQLNKKLNKPFKNLFNKLRSKNQNKFKLLLFQNQKLLYQLLSKLQLPKKLKKPQLSNKLQLNKKLSKQLKKVNKNQLKVKDNQEVTTETEVVQETTEDQGSTEDQDKTEVQESTENPENQELREKEKEEDMTTPTSKDQTTNQRIKNKNNKMILTLTHLLKENKLPETSKKKKSDNSLMKDSKLLENQNQKPNKDKRNGMRELTEEKLITIIKIDWMYI